MKKSSIKGIQENRGITLIALVITIIVLLILAGVSIAMLSGDNSILQRATDSKEKTERAEIVENARLDVLSEITDNKGNDITESQLKSVLKKYFKNNEIPEELPEDLSTLELTTLKNEKYKIKVSEIYDGGFTKQSNTTLASDVLHVDLTGATDSEISQYVLYEDKNGDDMLCRVLYSDGGTIEIVSVDAIDTVILGYNDPTIPASADGYDFIGSTGRNSEFEKARWSYNNAITTLNDKATTYLNTSLSDRARCIGSNPTTPSSQSESFSFPEGYTPPTGYTEMPNLLDGDNNYNTDYTRLQAIGADGLRNSGSYYRGIDCGNVYWFASRNLVAGSVGLDCGLRILDVEHRMFQLWSIKYRVLRWRKRLHS